MTLTIYNLIILSWTIQSAMALILLCAMFGVAVSFNRAAMRGLAAGWAWFTLLTFVELAGSLALTADPNTPFLVPISAAALACIVMIGPWWMHAADALAGKRDELWPPVRRLAPWIAAAVIVAVGTIGGALTGRSAYYLAQPMLLVSVSTFLTVHAWRRSRGKVDNPRLLRLLVFAIALMPARIAITWIFRSGVELRQQGVTQLSYIVVGQVLQALATGVIIIVVALGEERSATITKEKQLRDAEARLLDSRRFESLGRLASGVAHDFNNVLTVVMGGVDSIRRQVTVTPDLAEDLSMVESAVSGAGDLVKQLVTYAHSTGDESASTFDASARLRSSVELLRKIAGGLVKLELAAPKESLVVTLQPTRFDQVVLNLVVNGRDAMPNGGTMTITASDELRLPARAADGTPLAGGRYLRLSVADTGAGIPDDVLPHVFEPFFSTKSSVGSGLGLATVQRIVREANGDVVVSTEVGHGTMFEVLLPLRRSTPAGTAVAS